MLYKLVDNLRPFGKFNEISEVRDKYRKVEVKRPPIIRQKSMLRDHGIFSEKLNQARLQDTTEVKASFRRYLMTLGLTK